MLDKQCHEQSPLDLSETTHGIRRIGTRIAPAVALLMLSDSVYATDGEDTGSDTFSISEPSSLGLLAAGAAVGGVVAYIRGKRRK
jgi:hypothetical protein